MPELVVTRTSEEIVARIEEVRMAQTDLFGAQYSNLVLALPFEHAKQYLKPEITEDSWTVEDPLSEARKYMDFATGKAIDHRGLSAGRSIDHYRSWMWLLGLEDQVNWDDYPNYGAPILKQIAGLIDAEWPDDEGLERMAQGEACSDDCEEGCDA